LLLLVALGAVAFFAWGLVTPRLDEVWRIAIELQLGARPALSRAELRHLQDALADHPQLADHLTEGEHAGIFSAHEDGRVEGEYAYLVRRSPQEPGRLEVAFAGSETLGMVEVTARTTKQGERGRAEPGEPFAWTLPDSGPFPQLVEIRLKKGRAEQDEETRRHAVRIDLRGER
jgi:hypothetical protein